MGMLDFFVGGNSRVSAKSTMDIFNDGVSMYGSLDRAYRYTYIFRLNTIAKYCRDPRGEAVASLFREGVIKNCTYITIANLNTGAAPQGVYFSQTYNDFHEGIAKNLRKFGMPEKYITGNNDEIVADIVEYLKGNQIVSPEIIHTLVENM